MLLYRSTHIVLRTILLIYVQWKRAHCLFFVRSTNWMQQKLGENEWRRKTAIVESSHNNSNDKKKYNASVHTANKVTHWIVYDCRTHSKLYLQKMKIERDKRMHARINKPRRTIWMIIPVNTKYEWIWFEAFVQARRFSKKNTLSIVLCIVFLTHNSVEMEVLYRVCLCMHQIFKLNRWNFSFNPFITHGIEMNAGKKA